MKTLLIVEDEKMIRKGIRTMVQRSGVPVDVIMECSNGEMALEVLKEQQIDVMFTDIRMPKMDGIELVEKVSAMDNPPLVVAISGYDDFSYAVDMMRNGVREYILKPVEREKVKEVLEKLNEEIENRQEKHETERKFGEQQIRHVLTSEYISDEEIALLKEKYDSFFLQGNFVCCCFEQNAELENVDSFILLKNVDGNQVCLMEANYLKPFLKNEIPDMAVGISRPHSGIEEIRISYDEAMAARGRAFCIDKTVRYGEEREVPAELVKQAQKYISSQEEMRRLQLIGTSKTDELIDAWEHLFKEVSLEHISAKEFVRVMKNFWQEVVKIYKNSIMDEDRELVEKYSRVLSFSGLECYKNLVTNWILGLNERINNQEDTNRNLQKMKMAVRYIEENYASDLNMAVVSNYISMNYSLFSYSFKQYTGTNFVSYLKEIRIREAKHLLETTEMKVIEISQTVGYDNEKHFMKTFKSVCGVSPSEYRKNMQVARRS